MFTARSPLNLTPVLPSSSSPLPPVGPRKHLASFLLLLFFNWSALDSCTALFLPEQKAPSGYSETLLMPVFTLWKCVASSRFRYEEQQRWILQCCLCYALFFLKICVFIILINETRLGILYIFYFPAYVYIRLHNLIHILLHLTVQFNNVHTLFHIQCFIERSMERIGSKMLVIILKMPVVGVGTANR